MRVNTINSSKVQIQRILPAIRLKSRGKSYVCREAQRACGTRSFREIPVFPLDGTMATDPNSNSYGADSIRYSGPRRRAQASGSTSATPTTLLPPQLVFEVSEQCYRRSARGCGQILITLTPTDGLVEDNCRGSPNGIQPRRGCRPPESSDQLHAGGSSEHLGRQCIKVSGACTAAACRSSMHQRFLDLKSAAMAKALKAVRHGDAEAR